MNLLTPEEIADHLLNNAYLTEDQANIIAADIYQPLKDEIDKTQEALIKLTAYLAVQLGHSAAKEIINSLTDKVNE